MASFSWADDCDEDAELPPPPPVPVVTIEEKKSYAELVIQPAASAPTPRKEPPPQTTREAWNHVPLRSSKSTGAITKTPRVVRTVASCQRIELSVVAERREPKKPREIKCDNCHEQRGHLQFTERHVEAQLKEGVERLEVGTYCLTCVTVVAPRCCKPDCTGKKEICLPGANYPFTFACRSCMNAHRASQRS